MDFILEYYFDFGLMGSEFDRILDGFYFTLKLCILGGVLSLLWGLVLAVLRQLPGKAALPVRILTIAYIDIFRGIPLLLIILFVSSSLSAFAGEDLIPRWLGQPEWLGQTTAFWYGIFALTLTYGAYMAEVYRAGIEAVPYGQTEAARSLGMSHGQAMRHVILPQAVRKVIPPLLNDFIALTKDTALVSIIGLVELTQAGSDIASEFFNNSGYVLGALFYLLLTIPLARLVDWLIAREQDRTRRGGGGQEPAVPTAQGGIPSAGSGGAAL